MMCDIWTMFTDDIVICCKSREQVEENLEVYKCARVEEWRPVAAKQNIFVED